MSTCDSFIQAVGSTAKNRAARAESIVQMTPLVVAILQSHTAALAHDVDTLVFSHLTTWRLKPLAEQVAVSYGLSVLRGVKLSSLCAKHTSLFIDDAVELCLR